MENYRERRQDTLEALYSFFILPAYQGYHGLVQFINLFLLFQYPDKPSRRKESIVRVIPAYQGPILQRAIFTGRTTG